jgi:hypothetical protein
LPECHYAVDAETNLFFGMTLCLFGGYEGIRFAPPSNPYAVGTGF